MKERKKLIDYVATDASERVSATKEKRDTIPVVPM
jgi:hypothetical protein